MYLKYLLSWIYCKKNLNIKKHWKGSMLFKMEPMAGGIVFWVCFCFLLFLTFIFIKAVCTFLENLESLKKSFFKSTFLVMMKARKLSSFLKSFYWSIVDLQCCVRFCYTKWFSDSVYIYPLFKILFSCKSLQSIEQSSL